MKSLFCYAVLAIATNAFVSAPLHAQEPPTLKMVRDLRIDGAEQDLSPITFLAVAPNGAMAIAQNQDGLVRFFDARGVALGTFGRKGQGPGEFGTVGRFTWIADTLVVADLNARRFTLISPDRKLVRTVLWPTITMAAPSGAQPPRFVSPLTYARYSDGSFLVSASLAEGSPVPDWPGGAKPGSPLVRVDSTGVVQRLIAWRPETECVAPFDAGRGGRGFASIPFCAMVILDVAANGDRFAFTWVEHGGRPAYRVAVFRANGDTVFNRSYTYEAVPITKAAKDSAVAFRSRNPQIASALANAKLPDTHPPLLRILPGRDDTIWLELNQLSGDRVWTALDARGNPFGRIALPRNTRLMVASRETIWAIEADADGLESVVRFRVTR